MMSIYDGNTKKKPRQNSQLLFTIHCTHFKSASHSSIFLPNTLTCLVPPQRSTNDIIKHLILYNIFSQRFSIFPLNLFTFFFHVSDVFVILKMTRFYFLSFSSLIFLFRANITVQRPFFLCVTEWVLLVILYLR